MDVKDIFKPTIAKIILFLLAMAGLNYLMISTTHVLDSRVLVGLPLGFWPTGSFYQPAGYPPPPSVGFSWINFIVDMLFWYVVSCLIVTFSSFIYKKKK